MGKGGRERGIGEGRGRRVSGEGMREAAGG